MATRDGGTPPANAPDYERRKWEFLRLAPFDDATTENMKCRAVAIRRASFSSPWPDYVFALVAFALAKDGIVYQLDTDRVGREQIDGFTDPRTNPDEPFVRGYDDCDGKARFFVALCSAAGLNTNMVPRWDLETGKLAHVYARVWAIGPNAPTGRWWAAETILRRARLGDIAESVPKEPETGKWSQ